MAVIVTKPLDVGGIRFVDESGAGQVPDEIKSDLMRIEQQAKMEAYGKLEAELVAQIEKLEKKLAWVRGFTGTSNKKDKRTYTKRSRSATSDLYNGLLAWFRANRAHHFSSDEVRAKCKEVMNGFSVGDPMMWSVLKIIKTKHGLLTAGAPQYRTYYMPAD